MQTVGGRTGCASSRCASSTGRTWRPRSGGAPPHAALSTYEGDADAVAPGKRSSASEGAAEIKSTRRPTTRGSTPSAPTCSRRCATPSATVDHPVGAPSRTRRSRTRLGAPGAVGRVEPARRAPRRPRRPGGGEGVLLLRCFRTARRRQRRVRRRARRPRDPSAPPRASCSRHLSRADGKPPPPDLWSALRPPLSYEFREATEAGGAADAPGAPPLPPAADAPPLGHLLSDGDIGSTSSSPGR